MTDEEMVAAIKDIIKANARAFMEPPTVGLRVRPDGSVRIQSRRAGRWVRGDYKHYTSLTACYEASLVAARRAARVAELVASGLPTPMAVSESIYEIRQP